MRTSALSQLRRGMIEYCVLALRARREHCGFALVRTLGSVDALALPERTIYPLLSRLRARRS